MQWCLDRAKLAPEAERPTLLRMAMTFARGAIQIEKSVALIAESKDLLVRVDQLIPRLNP
jgi:hypothetical protein